MRHSHAREIERPGFDQRLIELRERLVAQWLQTPTDIPRLGPRRSRWQQWKSGRLATRIADDLSRDLERLSQHQLRQRRWQAQLKARLLEFGLQHLDWPQAYRRIQGVDAMFHSATGFVRMTRRAAPELDREAIGQALRNVLIAESLAILMHREDVDSRPLHAYSLLYPYTDNFLDQEGVSSADKKCFGQRLARRLGGFRVDPTSPLEERIHHQIALIETAFPRHGFPHVMASLEAIHRAQIASLRLHQAGHDSATEEILISTTFDKGGASVLADGYLIHGSLSRVEHDFCFAFGVILQLLDDLQDVDEDRQSGHRTIFTEARRNGRLDQPTSRLLHFIRAVFASSQSSFDPGMADLLERNSTSLLVSSIALSPQLFSRSFRRSIERRWPLRFRDLGRLHRRVEVFSRRAIERSTADLADCDH